MLSMKLAPATVSGRRRDDVEEIYEIRKAVECAAIAHANSNMKLNELLEMAEQLERLKGKSGPKWKEEQAAHKAVPFDGKQHFTDPSHCGSHFIATGALAALG